MSPAETGQPEPEAPDAPEVDERLIQRLTEPQRRALQSVVDNGTVATTTQGVRRLGEMGLIESVKNPGEGPLYITVLTPVGKASLDRANRRRGGQGKA